MATLSSLMPNKFVYRGCLLDGNVQNNNGLFIKELCNYIFLFILLNICNLFESTRKVKQFKNQDGRDDVGIELEDTGEGTVQVDEFQGPRTKEAGEE